MSAAFAAQCFSRWEEDFWHLPLFHQSQYLGVIKTWSLYRLNAHANFSVAAATVIFINIYRIMPSACSVPYDFQTLIIVFLQGSKVKMR